MNTDHYLKRIRAGLRPESNSLVRFIQEETFINLRPYSFVGHEYQQYFTELVEKDQNVDITAEKCSQIGLSEICFRISLGLMALYPGFSVAYAMPSKTFSQEVLKTRMSPIIDQSPALSQLISHDVDSASVKMFKNGSILYALGASLNSKATLINRPVALALTDELDRCDPAIHSGLRSRQKHSQFGKPRIAVSTPTAPGIGINAEADDRQLHYQVFICAHCNQEFVPDYYEQVKIPGYTDPLSTLTSEKVRSLNLNTSLARHHCPHCRALVSDSPALRRWEVERQHLTKIHLRLTPFDAPTFITPSDLVTSQLTYTSRTEFDNQELGLPAQMSDSSIDTSKIEFTHDETPEGMRIAGLDLGKVSHYMEGVLTPTLIFVDVVRLLGIGELETEVNMAINLNRIVSIVSDAQPLLDLVNRFSNKHPMFWPAYYLDPVKPMPEMYKLQINSEERVRQININKNLVFDSMAEALMTGQIVFRHSEYDQLIINHIGDLRRVRDHRYSELRYKWQKSQKGVDHLFHTLCYLFMASKIIRQGLGGSLSLPTGSLFSTFRMKQDL